MNTLGDFFRKQVSPQDQRVMIQNEIQRLFPEFFKQYQHILSQPVDNLESLHRIKAQIGSNLGNETQHLWRYLDDIRQNGYQSVNYWHFFDLARWLVDKLEEISCIKGEVFSLLDGHKKNLENLTWDDVVPTKSHVKASFNILPPQHNGHKNKHKKPEAEQQSVDITQIAHLIQQVGFPIPTEKHSTIIHQLQDLPDISQRRLLAHLKLLNQCTSTADKYRYMTKLRNGRISIKFDYENFYRLGIEKDGTCFGILAKGHEYDNFIKP